MVHSLRAYNSVTFNPKWKKGSMSGSCSFTYSYFTIKEFWQKAAHLCWRMDTLIAQKRSLPKHWGVRGIYIKPFGFGNRRKTFWKDGCTHQKKSLVFFFIFTYWRWLNRRFIWFMVVYFFYFFIQEYRDYLGSFGSLSWLPYHSLTKRSLRV